MAKVIKAQVWLHSCNICLWLHFTSEELNNLMNDEHTLMKYFYVGWNNNGCTTLNLKLKWHLFPQAGVSGRWCCIHLVGQEPHDLGGSRGNCAVWTISHQLIWNAQSYSTFRAHSRAAGTHEMPCIPVLSPCQKDEDICLTTQPSIMLTYSHGTVTATQKPSNLKLELEWHLSLSTSCSNWSHSISTLIHLATHTHCLLLCCSQEQSGQVRAVQMSSPMLKKEITIPGFPLQPDQCQTPAFFLGQQVFWKSVVLVYMATKNTNWHIYGSSRGFCKARLSLLHSSISFTFVKGPKIAAYATIWCSVLWLIQCLTSVPAQTRLWSVLLLVSVWLAGESF